MRTLALILLLMPVTLCAQSRGWFLMPLVNGNIQADSLAFLTGDSVVVSVGKDKDTVKAPVYAGGFSIATLNWNDSMALVLVHTSPARITALGKRFSYLGTDEVAVKDSVVVKDGKATPLIDSKEVISLPTDKGKVTATSLQQVMNAYKIPVATIGKVSIGVKPKVEAKPIEEKPIDVVK
jgi:hypothetical protein